MDYSTYTQVFEQLIDRINHPKDGLPPFSLEILRIRLVNEYFHPTYDINPREKWRLFVIPKTEVPEFKLYHEFRPKRKWVHELYHIRYCIHTGCKNMVIRKRLVAQKRFPTKEGNICDVCQKKANLQSQKRIYEAHHEIRMETAYQQQKQLYAKVGQIPRLIRKDCFTVQWYADMFEIEQSFTKSECYTKVKEELKRVMKLLYYKHPKKVIENYKRFYHIKPGVKFMVDGE
jgi:hypothetical protein